MLKVNPDIAVDFFLLNLYVVGKSLCEEKYNTFSDFAERTVFAYFTETIEQRNVKSGFFLDFTNCRLLFVFALFNVTFRKAPVSAVAVLYKQNFRVLLCFVKDYRTAVLSIKSGYAFLLYIFQT